MVVGARRGGGLHSDLQRCVWWTVFLLSAPRFATGSAPTQADCLLPVLIFGKCPCVLGIVRGAKIRQRGETGKAPTFLPTVERSRQEWNKHTVVQ